MNVPQISRVLGAYCSEALEESDTEVVLICKEENLAVIAISRKR
jgi:hypothetical protein